MRWSIVLLPLLASATVSPGRAGETTVTAELLAEAVISQPEDLPFGGLSALVYDPERDLYYALSDDSSIRAPARFYTVRIPISAGRLDAGGIRVLGVTPLRDPAGRTFPPHGIDPEGLARSRTGFVLASEGEAERAVPPFVRRLDLDGRVGEPISLPTSLFPSPDGTSGVRPNLSLEALTLSPNGDRLFVGIESALAQDGPVSGPDEGAVCRILLYRWPEGLLEEQRSYAVDPWHRTPLLESALNTSGLSELLALSSDLVLALERSYGIGAGFSSRLYVFSVSAPAEGGRALPDAPRLAKHLVLDFRQAGVHPENYEGMTLGPRLPDGRQLLVVLSDDNFRREQSTRLVALALQVPGDGERSEVISGR